MKIQFAPLIIALLHIATDVSAFQQPLRANGVKSHGGSFLRNIHESKQTGTRLSLLPNDIANELVSNLSGASWENLPAEVKQLSLLASPLISVIESLPKESYFIFPAVTLFSILYALSFPKDDFRRGFDPYERGSYDPFVAKAYYAKNPMLVLLRSLQLIRLSNRFVISILSDKYIFKNEEKMREKRYAQILSLMNISITIVFI